MPVLQCPVDGCQWTSQDLGAEFAAALTAALQIHDRAVHATSANPIPPKPKLDPPSVSAGCDPDQWSAFVRQWDMYKVGTAVTAAVLPTALFYCCDADLRTDVLRDLQCDVANMAEDDLLAAVKRLAVKDESTLVHRIKLSKMMQSPGTGIRTFLASLRGQAALCQYRSTCKVDACTHVFDYSDEIIKDNLVRGIADPEILSDLLGDPKTDRTLEETVSFIAQKEQGKATKCAVGDSAGPMCATQTNYKPPSPSPGTKCWACGGASHGPRNDRRTRSQHCEAWTFTCGKCSSKGHFTAFCSKCTTCGNWGNRDASSRVCPHTSRKNPPRGRASGASKDVNPDKASYVYDQLCTTSEDIESSVHTCSQDASPTGPGFRGQAPQLAHHVFDGRWIARPSMPHPMLSVTVTPLPEDHASFGHPILNISKLKSVTMSMVADTGCQSSIMPLKSAYAMGMSKKDLLPVKLVMRGAIKEDLGVMGAVVVNISTGDINGSTRSTRIFCYISATMENAFLCREALISLGAIPTDFPNAMHGVTASVVDSEEVTCSCPKRRTEPPPLPTSLPPGLKATEENIQALKDWLLDYYISTTSNVCGHQPLPLMKGEPLQLHIDPETKASPALILFGRPIRDAIPIPMGRYSPHETWTELMSHREKALARRHAREHERWNEHTHQLPPLKVGDHVFLQNLVGNHPRRWERTGIVVEVRQYHQYVIRVDGTGRMTLRNRQHLRKFTPFHSTSPGAAATPSTTEVRPSREVMPVDNVPVPAVVNPTSPPQNPHPSAPSSPQALASRPSPRLQGSPPSGIGAQATSPSQESLMPPRRLAFDTTKCGKPCTAGSRSSPAS